MDPLDIYGDKKHLKKAFSGFIEEKKKDFKEYVKKILPPPASKMVDTPEGSYTLIAIAIMIFILFLKFAGITLRFFSKLIFFLALIAAIYFGYLYFTNYH